MVVWCSADADSKFMMKADIVVFCVIVLCCKVQVACLGTIISGHEYKIVDLEENRAMCRGSSLVSNRVIVLPETPAIIRLGHTSLHNPASVDSCELKIEAPSGYGVSLTINSMNLNFRRDKFTGSISCHDYVQFSRKWDNFVAKALAKVSDTFADRSEVICRQKYQMDIDRPELYNVGKTANIYHSVKNEVEFEYERGGERNRDKEFTIVATAFKKTNGTCPEEYIRCGIKSVSFCIAERLRCDGFVNCGFPSSGVDEEGCSAKNTTMSTHTFVWVTLVLALAVFICCLISCAMRCWVPSQSSPHPRLRLWFPGTRSPVESRPASSSGPIAAERAHLSPLPSYDSVVRHLDGLQSPPSYKDLFPEPPPSPPGTDRLPLNPLLKTVTQEESVRPVSQPQPLDGV